MKTILKALFISTLTFMVMSQGYGQTTPKSDNGSIPASTAVQCKFVDSNNNGICDNHEMKGKDGQCANFVDKDGNGICDNCAKKGNCGQANACAGHQSGISNAQGTGNCPGHNACAGKGQGKCCGNQQATPAETPSEPKK